MHHFTNNKWSCFSSHLTWKLSWTPLHKWSPLFQWTWTGLNFPLQKGLPQYMHCRLWNIVHGSNLNWSRFMRYLVLSVLSVDRSSVLSIIFIEFLWVYECLPLLRLTIEKPCLLRIFESFFWRFWNFFTKLWQVLVYITAQALVLDLADPDYSLVTFSGCGAFLWITVPTFCHQLAPEGWRLLAALPVNWAVTFTHPVKEFLQRCYWSVSKIPYYRKLTFHEIKVLEINAT